MAERQISFGSVGPFLYDDEDGFADITVEGDIKYKFPRSNPVGSKFLKRDGSNDLEWGDGSGHDRAHDVDSALDHNAAAVGNLGKFVKANVSTGAIEFNTIALDDLSDVNTTGKTDDDVLTYDGSGWIASPVHTRLHDMDSALDHATADAGDKGKFVKANNSTGAIEFSFIQDADIPSTIMRVALDSSPDSDHGYSGHTCTMTIDSGQTVAFGTPLYIASDGELVVADADADTSMPAMFLATGAGVGAQTVLMVSPGTFVRDDSWSWTVGGTGGVIYISTSGTLTQTRPNENDDIVQPVGVAISATVALFCSMAFVKVSA